MKDVIIGCCLQRSYLHEKGSNYLGEAAEILKTRLLEYFKKVDRQNNIIYFLREIRRENDTFFKNEKSGALVGTPDIEILEIFKSYPKFIINLSTYNGFYSTPLESELHKQKPSKVYVVGVETHTNVLFTAEGLRNRSYDVVVNEALVTSKDSYMHAAGINILCNSLAVDVV